MKKITVGLAGVGRAAWGMQCPELEERAELFQLVACYDPISDRNLEIQKRFGQQIKAYESFQELVSDPSIELISIASPSKFHFEQAKIGLQAGKHIFLEKPMCINLANAKKLADIEEKSSGTLFIRHNRRFEAGFIHIKNIIDSGILGKVFSIKLSRHKYVRRDDWQAISEFGGGQLLNWGPHIIDHGLNFLNYNYSEIWSHCQNTVSPGNAEDHVKILLKSTDNCVVDIEISGGAAFKENTYVIFGTRGALRSNNKTIQIRYLNPNFEFKKLTAKTGTPPLGLSYHQNPDNEKFDWIEEEYKIKDKVISQPSDIWNHVYSSLRLRKSYPIEISQALKVMEVIEKIKATN